MTRKHTGDTIPDSTQPPKPRRWLRHALITTLSLTILGGFGVAYFFYSLTHGGTWNGANIPVYTSQVDKDGDGIDDQSDILQGAKAYIATNPVYKSKYYEDGYPDDEYGVCTDVNATALAYPIFSI